MHSLIIKSLSSNFNENKKEKKKKFKLKNNRIKNFKTNKK